MGKNGLFRLFAGRSELANFVCGEGMMTRGLVGPLVDV